MTNKYIKKIPVEPLHLDKRLFMLEDIAKASDFQITLFLVLYRSDLKYICCQFRPVRYVYDLNDNMTLV